MERNVHICKALIENEKEIDCDGKSLKISVLKMSCGFLKDGASRPQRVFRPYAKCGLETSHMPPDSKVVEQSNNQITDGWKRSTNWFRSG